MKPRNIELEKLEQFKQQKRQKLLEEIEKLTKEIEGKVEKAAVEKLKNDIGEAVQQNNPEKIKALVEIKADPNCMFDNDTGGFRGRKYTTLSYAISCTALEAIKALLEAKADPNQKIPGYELWYKHSWGGSYLQYRYPSQTPLEYALGSGACRDVLSQQNIIGILLKNGAEITTAARQIAADDHDLFSFMLKEDYLDSERINTMKSTFTFFWDNMEKKFSEVDNAKQEIPAVMMIKPLTDLIGSYLSTSKLKP